MTLYVQVYKTEKAARDAARKLAEAGQRKSAIYVMTPKAEAESEASYSREVQEAIEAGRLPESHANVAEGSLAKGRTVLSVDANLGFGKQVLAITEEFKPIPIDPGDLLVMDLRLTSEQVGIPLLWRNGRTFAAKWFGGLLTDPNYKATGSDLLIDEAAPLSSRVKLKLLTEPKKEWKRSFGLPLLIGKAAPLSESLNIDTLREPPKDWTESYGLRLLISDPTPVSRLIGFPVLTR